MKAKIIRDDMEISPSGLAQNPHPRNYVEKRVMRNGRWCHRKFWKVGAVIDHPKAHFLVQNGCAEPADDECRDAAGMTAESAAEAQRVYERTNKGIHPDDFEDFDAGRMVGYDGEGNPIPGPNAATFDDDADEETEVEDLSGEY